MNIDYEYRTEQNKIRNKRKIIIIYKKIIILSKNFFLTQRFFAFVHNGQPEWKLNQQKKFSE